MRQAICFLCSPIGKLRAEFAWRFFGLVVLEITLMAITSGANGPSGSPPFSLLAVGASGLLLMLAGPRLISLLMLSGFGSLLLFEIAGGRTSYQLAEEFLPIALFPGVGALASAWIMRSARSGARDTLLAESDEAQISLFRLAAICMMLFAALHKLNVDFFDPTVSCATSHAGRFLRLASAGPGLFQVVPFMAILAELAVPTLLVFAPRIGLPAAIAIMFYIGHRGATPFTQLVMMLAVTFLDEADLRTLLDFIRRRWIALLALLALASLASVMVLRGADWARYYPWILVTTALGFGAMGLLLSRVAAFRADRDPSPARRALRAEFARATLLPKNRGARALLVGMTCALILNAMTPYFGTKFRLSFAMFSNLRVDDGSWNSLVFPKTIRLVPHDGYVHVEQVDRSADESRKGKPLDGLYRRGHLEKKLAERRRLGERFDLSLRFRGQEREFKHAAASVALSTWLRTLPDDHLLHDYLPPDGPQPCVH